MSLGDAINNPGEGGMNEAVENVLDRSYDIFAANVEGRRSVTIYPVMQIILGAASVIVGVESFQQPQDMVPGCMEAIMAAENSQYPAMGYVLLGSGQSVEMIDGDMDTVHIVGIAVDRWSWGKRIATPLLMGSGTSRLGETTISYEYGLFADTMFDPWWGETQGVL